MRCTLKNVTLTEYKVDFNCPIGKGLFGIVYALRPRDANDRSLLSYFSPLLHDWIYRAVKTEESSQYCIKLFMPCAYVIVRAAKHTIQGVLSNPKDIFFAAFTSPSLEFKAHRLLVKYNVTDLKFAQTTTYTQIKTRVQGKTLEQYIISGEFQSKNHKLLRLALYQFIKSSASCPLVYSDLNVRNLMFSEPNRKYEMVDGDVTEDLTMIPAANGLFEKAFQSLFQTLTEDAQGANLAILIAIFDAVWNRTLYNQDVDNKLLSRYTSVSI